MDKKRPCRWTIYYRTNCIYWLVVNLKTWLHCKLLAERWVHRTDFWRWPELEIRRKNNNQRFVRDKIFCHRKWLPFKYTACVLKWLEDILLGHCKLRICRLVNLRYWYNETNTICQYAINRGWILRIETTWWHWSTSCWVELESRTWLESGLDLKSQWRRSDHWNSGRERFCIKLHKSAWFLDRLNAWRSLKYTKVWSNCVDNPISNYWPTKLAIFPKWLWAIKDSSKTTIWHWTISRDLVSIFRWFTVWLGWDRDGSRFRNWGANDRLENWVHWHEYRGRFLSERSQTNESRWWHYSRIKQQHRGR